MATPNDPHAIERDHFALRDQRERGPGPYVEQFQCGMCGAWFLMRTSLERHKRAELPGFIAWSAAKREEYEISRGWHRQIVPVLDPKAMEIEYESKLRLVSGG